MRLIDEKGRLFGKLNIIDLLIVLLVLAGLLGVNYKLGLLKKFTAQETTQKKAVVKLWIKEISSYSAEAIKEGDIVAELKSNSQFGKISKVEIAPYKEAGTNSEGKWVLSEVPEKYNVFITVDMLNPSVNGEIKLGSKEAKVGASLEIKGPKFQVTSYVVGVE